MSNSSPAILITGAAGGLGRTAALALARQGASIILLDKRIPQLEEVYDQIIDLDAPEPAIYPFDLAGANEQQYQELADTILTTYGSLQGLLHSAVELKAFTPFEIHTTLDWGHSLNINLNAPFLLTRVLLPVMQKSDWASIVFTSDSIARQAKAYSGAYGVSKIALEGMARILAEELETENKIRVNVLVPGPVNSPLRRKLFPAEDKNQLPAMDSLDSIYQYLFSDSSSGITGQIIEAQSFSRSQETANCH